MKRTWLACAAIVLVLLSVSASAQSKHTRRKYPIGGSYPSGDKLHVVPDLGKRLAKFKPVDMPFRTQRLSAREIKMIEKLVDASRYLESIYWRQSDPDGLTLYQQLEGSRNSRDQQVLQYLFLNGSRFDLINNNQPFVGTQPMPPGRGLYPVGLTREAIEKYVAEHPEQKAEIYSSTTVVREQGKDLAGIPYHMAYRVYLGPAANDLREAAKLSDDPEFAAFLRARADALLTDDYYKSDLLWVDLKNPKVDIIFAPYETYLDDVLGVKGSYGAAVLIRNEAQSNKLAAFQKYVPDIQDALPLAAEDRPSKAGQPTPMEVVDAPFRAGDMLHGYQSVADNLPNDPRIHQEKGTKKIFFKNFMDARVNYVILPVARRLMIPEQAARASADGYLTVVMMHEICHGLGPAFARTSDGKKDIRESIGPVYSALEEAKADVTGMFGTKWMLDHDVLPKQREQEYYASYVAGILRSVRFGVAEAHGRAQMMEFNYLVEKGAITQSTTMSPSRAGSKRRTAKFRYSIDYAKMPAAIESLTKELLEIEGTGDRQRAEHWFSKYDKMPADLVIALQSASDVPVDVRPRYSFPLKVQ